MVRMRPPAALPPHLSSAPFTVYEARAAALGGSRLRASDLATAGRLLYLPAGWEFELRGLARALSAATPDAWISHLERRTEPWATLPQLAAMLARHPKLKGIVKAREALELIRPGADSAPETFLRLALTAAGLPEPELQLQVVPGDPRSPAADLGYRRYRIAIQYDGGHHLTREQQSRDNRRDETFNAEGWRYFKFNADDLADDFRSAVQRVRTALRTC